MFTGLIEEVGELRSLRRSARSVNLVIRCPRLAPELAIGASLAVDGVCLTLTANRGDEVEVQAVGATLGKTTLRNIEIGRRVNLERPMAATARLDGHFVLGHVTGRARIRSWAPQTGGSGPEAWFLEIDLDPAWMDRVIAEGSIAIDGISLTIAELKENSGSGKGSPSALMSVIPHTRKVTSILYKKPGDEVNVELDVLASYVGAAVAALLKGERGAAGPRESKVDLEQLRAWGYR